VGPPVRDECARPGALSLGFFALGLPGRPSTDSGQDKQGRRRAERDDPGKGQSCQGSKEDREEGPTTDGPREVGGAEMAQEVPHPPRPSHGRDSSCAPLPAGGTFPPWMTA
jgi:hypothetical protein